MYARASQYMSTNSSFVKGYLGPDKTFEQKIPKSQKKWKRIFFKNRRQFDQIVIGPHVEVDNIDFYLNLTEFESHVRRQNIKIPEKNIPKNENFENQEKMAQQLKAAIKKATGKDVEIILINTGIDKQKQVYDQDKIVKLVQSSLGGLESKDNKNKAIKKRKKKSKSKKNSKRKGKKLNKK